MGRYDDSYDANRSETDETTNLISSEKVDGTAVYSHDGDKVGHIHHFMVGKRNGHVEYAVMTCGGILGMGEEYRPVPWDALEYDTDLGGYVINIEKERIGQTPSYARDQEPTWDRSWGSTIYSSYGLPY
ncbi:photosystem reaction center subunit H [Novosphingobium endophyticum]|uniref:Photosystem reaction center subunit H n=1 Tax=Novosphingobium endophyticum TaxID=1955250 RepID=A0A916X771_9SPHN|nr:PRC-barrel domain-containing protein [Novosphingobium endophyticum]GGC11678.1 photosystem reaction center subunit H [Novosphingobium endophyticum]